MNQMNKIQYISCALGLMVLTCISLLCAELIFSKLHYPFLEFLCLIDIMLIYFNILFHMDVKK